MSHEIKMYDKAAVIEELRTTPRKQWQSLDELAAQDDLAGSLEHEHPREAALLSQNGLDRRTFLKVMGATLALTGITGCNVRPPDAEIIPYVEMPEGIVPGQPLFFSSTMTLGGYATGVVIETHEGRPTRIEGNPNHPASLGSSDPMLLASILELYNPERSTRIREDGATRTRDEFQAALNGALDAAAQNGGAGLRILTETITSPTLARQLSALLEAYPEARWHQYEPVTQDAVLEGAQLAFGQAVNTVYHFEQADVILALDADFLSGMPGSLRYARDFGARRKVRADNPSMNRLYAVESTPTLTGSNADHRLPLRASQVEQFAQALAAALGVSGVSAPGDAPWDAAWLDAVVADLQESGGRSIVIAGNEQTPAVHALVHAINAALGNVGGPVTYTQPIATAPVNQMRDLAVLATDMAAGAVETLIILGGNPAYTAPVDVGFADALQNVPLSIHLSHYVDETSQLCTWHVPQTHYIEEWGDARAFDGTASLVQPPIGPLYDEVHSAIDMLALLLQDGRTSYDIVRETWQMTYEGEDFEGYWRRALHNGVVEESGFAPIAATVSGDVAGQLSGAAADGVEIIFRPDPTIWDGRFALNSWLQELPKPLTLLTWDNAALISPAMAESMGLSNGDQVELQQGNNSVTAPIWILPGHPDQAVTVTLGYGRPNVDAEFGGGFNAYAVRTADAPWFSGGLTISPTGGTYPLASTQDQFRMDGADPVRAGTLAMFQENPEFIHEGEHKEDASLLPPFEYEKNAWGMSIDLTACIGCNACTIACQSENNIPSVGKRQVELSRHMHWIRVDRYYEDALENPQTSFQPVPCMHCEKAPCETVCPVQATVHDDEGLNVMVYNRCIGTRYCSGNCPYGVRRFNFLDYVEDEPILQELRNPDVTVRSRGVMEKCTYCVQRISSARIEAKKENRPIRDGEVMPACAAACPTQAIVFGDISNEESQVAQLKAQPHDYGLLAKLNTKPRTTYLARLANPNQALAPQESPEQPATEPATEPETEEGQG